MNNRIPIIVLVALVLIALIWRVANPPAPLPPGPLGAMPTWNSMSKLGDMGPWATDPSGTMWAGAWNLKAKSGTLRSAVWIIDFEKEQSALCHLDDGAYVSSLWWANDKTVGVLKLNTKDVEAAEKSEVFYIDAATGKVERSVELKTPVARILDWPAGSDKFVAQLAGTDNVKVAVFNESGEIVGKEVSVDLPSTVEFHRVAALVPDGGLFVFSVLEDELGGNVSYYLGNTKDGSAKRVFRLNDLPGRVEDMWVSPTGILMVCSERDRLQSLVYNISTGALDRVGKVGKGMDFAKNWPDAPKRMTFVTLTGGYTLDVRRDKVSREFKFPELTARRDYWRQEVQDGRLYPRKDHDYTSVSLMANAIDIRIIKKTGTTGRELLSRR